MNHTKQYTREPYTIMNTITDTATTTIQVVSNYYIHDGHYYDIHFPLHYAMNHKQGTGPKECNNCHLYGSWRGVFIGYCANCAKEDYNFERGFGFNDRGCENYYQYTDRANCCSAFDTYLKNVDLDKIGDYQDGHPLDLLDFMGFPICIENDNNHILNYIDIKSFILDHGINPDYLPQKIICALRTGDFSSIFDEEEEEDDQSDFDYDIQNVPAFGDGDGADDDDATEIDSQSSNN